MKSHQEFYCILSVSDIEWMLKLAKLNQKKHHKTGRNNHTVSLRLVGARCPEECIVNGVHQVNWNGEMK
jgi:hypothetical protein